MGPQKENGRNLSELSYAQWIEAVEDFVIGKDSVTYDELLSLLPNAEEHLDLLESLLDELDRRGIAVLDEQQDEEPEEEEEVIEKMDRTAQLENIRPDDLLSFYLTEMSQEPLLTFEQEVDLAQRIERGRQAEKALQEADYTPEEYVRLRAQVEAGQAAREHLGRANTRLVVSIAKRYRGYGVPFTDLIQNGNVGLMRAVDRYDPDTGNRFSTYATWWIRQAVTRSLANQGRVIRIPVHTGGRMRKMIQTSQRLEKELGRRPTAKEIAEEMEESPEKVRQMMRWSRRPLSLEKPVGDEGEAELGQFIEDEAAFQPEELTDSFLLNEVLEELLANLTPREARILRLRYGLQDGQTRTLNQIAQKFDLSRERIRQIEQEALSKLRLVAPEYRLEHFLEGS